MTDTPDAAAIIREAIALMFLQFSPLTIDQAAQAAIDNLTAAGLLVPPGGADSTLWRVTYYSPGAGGRNLWTDAVNQDTARAHLAQCISEERWADPRVEYATVTRWPDGRTTTGPWVPA